MIDNHIIDFIQDHLQDDPDLLVLQKDKYPDIPLSFVATQIAIRQKFKSKFPFLISQPGFLFPSRLSYEQSSSEATAKYKSELFSGKEMADLTGGLGMDSLFFSRTFSKVQYIERESEISELALQNFKLLEAHNISVHQQTAEEWIKQKGHYDLIYLDPARRDQHARKVFKIEDCEPNVLNLYKTLLDKADHVLWKASPLLDIKNVLRQIPCRRVDVVAVGNEVKEVLFFLSASTPEHPEVNCVDLQKRASFSFNYQEEESADSDFSDPSGFIYEPGASIMKAGAFKSLGKRFQLSKLAPHSHLYSKDEIIPDFPGRVFRYIDTLKPSAKEVRRSIPDLKANLSCRNFPMKVEDLKKKLKLRDGGDLYLFATQDVNHNKILLLTETVQRKQTL